MFRIIILIIIGTFPIIIAIAFFLKYTKEKKALHYKKKRDREIIQIAKNQKGIITTLDIVTELDLSVDEAQIELERLYSKGVFKVEINEHGGVYYELNKGL